MPDRLRFDELPRWPVWVAFAAPVGGYVVGTLAALLLSRGLQETVGVTTFTAGLLYIALAAGAVATALAIAWRTGGAEPSDVGLAGFRGASALAWSALILAPSVAIAWAGLGSMSPADVLDVPAILLAAGPELAFGVPEEAIGLSPGVVVAGLSLCVAPAIATEILLRGIVMPSLAPNIGRTSAAVVAALLTPAPFGLFANPDSGGPVLAGALVAGAGISFIYLRDADLYPGIATLSFALGIAFGASLGWGAPGVAVTAFACSIAALAATRALEGAWPKALGRSPWQAGRAAF